MIFKLFTDNGVWLYDTIENCFYNPNGYRQFYTGNNQGNVSFDFSGERCEIENISISLGVKCNFHCKQCIQRFEQNAVEIRKFKIESLLENIKKFDLSKIRYIYFIGGEPLVYWKTLTEVVIELRKFIPKRIKLCFPSNGSLFTKEKYDFFKKYRLYPTISYDGKNSERDYDILSNEKIVDAIKYGMSIGVIASFLTLLGSKDTFSDMSNYIIERLGITKEDFEKDLIRIKPAKSIIFCSCNHSVTNNINSISKIEVLKKNIEKSKNILDEKINGFIESVRNNRLNINSPCEWTSGKSVVLDCDGNILECLHSKKPICKVEELKNHIFETTNLKLKKRECVECEYLNVCFNICPLTEKNYEEFKFNCSNNKILNDIIFKESFYRLFGRKIFSIMPLGEDSEKICNTI